MNFRVAFQLAIFFDFSVNLHSLIVQRSNDRNSKHERGEEMEEGGGENFEGISLNSTKHSGIFACDYEFLYCLMFSLLFFRTLIYYLLELVFSL